MLGDLRSAKGYAHVGLLLLGALVVVAGVVTYNNFTKAKQASAISPSPAVSALSSAAKAANIQTTNGASGSITAAGSAAATVQPAPSASAAAVPSWYVAPPGSPGVHPVSPGPTPPSTKTYLVNVTFTEGPTTPVCRTNAPCTAPIANHPVRITSGSGTYTTVTTDGAGKFSVYLPLGHYMLALVPPVGVNQQQTWSFDETGQYSLTMTFTADTGIR
jgi:hypothetical protein